MPSSVTSPTSCKSLTPIRHTQNTVSFNELLCAIRRSAPKTPRFQPISRVNSPRPGNFGDSSGW